MKNKELLLKDLCARLPYKVMAKYYDPEDECETWDEVEGIESSGHVEIGQYVLPIENVKPYLIPLSSISEELKNFIRWKLTTPKYDSFDEESLEDLLSSNMQIVHYCYEHHLDINGLIEKSLALDATGLNIY